MPALTTRDVQNLRPVGKTEYLDYPCRFLPVTLEREDWLVFEQIAGIEIRFPPFLCPGQKKTGSL